MDNQILLVCEYAICVATSFFSITQDRKLRTLRTNEKGNWKVMNIVPLQTNMISHHYFYYTLICGLINNITSANWNNLTHDTSVMDLHLPWFCDACLTWGHPPVRSAGGRSRQWPTPESRSRSRTASPSCPTPPGLAELELWSEIQYQPSTLY